MEKHIKVIFKPDDKVEYVLPGTTVLEAAGEAGIIIDTPCGRRGRCGKCKVRLLEGEIQPCPAENDFFSEDELSAGLRLACQAKINSPVTLEIPFTSRFSAQKILITDYGHGNKREVNPGVSKSYDPDKKTTSVFIDGEFVCAEKGDTSGQIYGIAVDIGTTTIVLTLIDMITGEDMAVFSHMNPQVSYGDDVISRIKLTIDRDNGLGKLHQAMINVINTGIHEVTAHVKVKKEHVYKFTAAGNSTMQHLFLNISPRSLGTIPFEPEIKDPVSKKAGEAGIKINENGYAYIFPNIAGFVGGDTVAVMLATRIFEGKKIRMAVDIGTNGEIVIGNEDKLICASTAAGPAFEGARISQGMRGSRGAIEKVVFSEDVMVNTIDNAEPLGICGSGLIDAVAGMVSLGIIDETGRILSASEISGKLPGCILERLTEAKDGNKFLIADAKKPIFITQKDIREVQLAKAAIFAGIKLLQKELGVSNEGIEEVFLAGAFGNFIRRENAIRIGLLPDMPLEKIKFVGNAASTGAKLVLLSENLRVKAEEIARSCKHIELAGIPGFQDEFTEAMMF